MKNFFRNLVDGIGLHEIFRVGFMIVLIAFLFYPDFGSLHTMGYVAGVFLGVALISHVVRKYALFPYLDLREYALKAKEEPLAAAIIFASVCGVIIVSIDTSAKFFVR